MATDDLVVEHNSGKASVSKERGKYGLIKLSANLGFLWTDRSLPDAIIAAKNAGFDAVECHWPQGAQSTEVVASLKKTGLSMLGINTKQGNTKRGDSGIAALVGREDEARDLIEQAIAYADQIDASNIHVMAGFTDKGAQAQQTFVNNLIYASQQAAKLGKTILIEPLNTFDAPNYHLSTLDEARAIIQTVCEPNLKIMFDCYHMQIMGGDLLRRFKAAFADIGHVQFAGVPDRNEPDLGEVDYVWLFNEMKAADYMGLFGAEYKPASATDASLGWMRSSSASRLS